MSIRDKKDKIVRFGRCLNPMVFWGCALLCLVLLQHPTVCRGQATTAEVSGSVKNANGAAILQAKIVLTNQDTKEARTASPDQSGNFTLSLLPPGQYVMQITAKGFKTATVQQFTLRSGDHASIHADMQKGAIDQSIPLTAVIAATASTGISGKAVEDIPERQRNYVNLAQIQAGANEGSSAGAANGDSNRPGAQHITATVSVNGQPDSMNQHLIDGMDNNEKYQGISLVHPSMESVASVQVKSSGVTADIGRTTGGALMVSTKSGTNVFHGGVFEFFRNDIFDPTPYQFGAHGRKPEIRQNQFGGSLGGPLQKGKTFFFGDYEGFRLVQGFVPQSVVVPTAYEHNNPGDFSDIGGTVLSPSQIDPIGLAYFMMYPVPNTGGSDSNTYSGAGSGFNYTHNVDFRIDRTLAKKSKVDFVFNYFNVSAFTPGVLPVATYGGVTIAPGGNTANFPGGLEIDAYRFQPSFTHSFNQHWSLSLAAQYVNFLILKTPLGYGTYANETWGQPNININLKTSGLAPITVLNGDNIGNADYSFPNPNHENLFEYKGAVTFVHGAHQVRFGGDLIRRDVRAPQDPNGAGQWTFSNYQTLLQGVYTAVQRNFGLVIQHLATWEPSAFVTDTWRLEPNLTVEAGLRYEVYTPYTEEHNYMSTFDPVNVKILVAGQNGVNSMAGLSTKHTNFAPRVGFSWQTHDKTVITGSAGMVYFMPNLKNRSENINMPYAYGYGPCSSTTCAAAYSTFADGLPYPTTPDMTNPTGSMATPVDPQFRPSYNYIFNLGVQHKIAGNMVRIGYANEMGRHLHQMLPDVNTPAPNTATNVNPLRPFYSVYPNLRQVALLRSEGVSMYNGLQVVVNKPMSHHYSYSLNYTWAHGLDDATNPNGNTSGLGVLPSEIGKVVAGHRFDYGNSDMDVRHRIAANVMYALPYRSDWNGLRKTLTAHWEVNAVESWSTGVPFSVTNASMISGALPGQNNSERSNMIASPTLNHPGVKEFFNTEAFQAQQKGTVGQLFGSDSDVGSIGSWVESKNALHGPHNRRLDASLAKTFPLGAQNRYNIVFRAEIFNVTNTMNFAPPNHSLVPDSTGYQTTQSGTTLLTGGYPTNSFGALTAPSGNYMPRDIQFALKFQY